jgi:nickel/cobalt exporter
VSAGRRLVAGLLLVAGLVLLPAAAVAAHPLGNFSVNSYLGVRVQPDVVEVAAVVDLAEIPTQSEVVPAADGDRDGRLSDAERAAYGARRCPEVAAGVKLATDGAPLALSVTGTTVAAPPGAAGLPTLRLTCRLRAPLTVRPGTTLTLVNDNYRDRVGWREVTAVGDRVTLVDGDVPAASVSQALTSYPTDLLSSPPDVRTATLRLRPGGPPAPDPLGAVEVTGVQRRGVDGLTARFTDLVGRPELTVGVGLVAVGLALFLGALHAFAPGHGKTVMAAYLVGGHGTRRQVVLIGLTVTATHTVGVLLLGVALSVTSSVAPEHLYPWLGLVGGLLLLGIGTTLLRAARRRPAVDHHHDHHDHDHHDHDHHDHDHHDHDHHDHDEREHHHHDQPALAGPHRGSTLTAPRPAPLRHSHGGREHSHLPADPTSLRTRDLLLVGLAGGLVPTPSAVVVLVGALALGRAWFGVLLVVGYGLGMAATLVTIGALLARGRGALERRWAGRRSTGPGRWLRLLPVATSLTIVVVGVLLILRAVGQLAL